MGVQLEVKGKINFKLENYEIRGYKFSYAVPDSKYAKGHEDERYLEITGNISEMLEKSPDVLEEIREWTKVEYKDPTYYNWSKITHDYRGEFIRGITFPDAFIKEYHEEINPHTGHGTFTLVLFQKMDKRIDIIVEPFNEKFPKLSNVMNPEPNFNKVVARTGLSAVAVGSIMQPGAGAVPLNEEVLRKRTITVRGATFKLSRESYRRITEVPRTTGGTANGSGVSMNKEFNGDFVTMRGTPDRAPAASNGVFQHPYGGDQHWFDSVHMRGTGCGSVAASNVLFYYAQSQFRLGALARNGNLGSIPTWEHFRDYAADMYNSYTPQTINIPAFIANTINIPPSFGIWFMNPLADGVVRFARSQGVTLTSSVITNRDETYNRAVNFIRTALQSDNPVVLLVTGNDYIARRDVLMLELHFVTITAMTEIREIEISTNSEGREVSRVDLGVVDYELRTSDWGLRRFIPSLKQMWESNTTLEETAPRALEAAGVNIPPRLINTATSIFSGLPLASVSLASFTPGAVEWVPLDGREDLPIWV